MKNEQSGAEVIWLFKATTLSFLAYIRHVFQYHHKLGSFECKIRCKSENLHLQDSFI